jgi:hypothetical protein
MTRQAKIAAAAVLGLMALTAFLLGRSQSMQRIGQPGVRLVAGPVYGEKGELVATNTVDLPERVLNFESKAMPIARIVLDWLPKDTTYAQRSYQAPDGFGLTANVVLMGADRTSIHKPEYCLTGQGMHIEKKELCQIPIAGPHPFSLPVMKMTSGWESKDANGGRIRRRVLYVYWFVADGEVTATHNERMWWMARDLITQGVLQRWAYVACLAVCEPGQENAAYARMEQFIAAAVPHFQLTGGSTAAVARNH